MQILAIAQSSILTEKIRNPICAFKRRYN